MYNVIKKGAISALKFEKKTIYYIVLTFVICLFIQSNWAHGAGFLRTIFKTIQPFLMGAGIAYVVNIVMSAYERVFERFVKVPKLLAMKRGLSLLMAYLTFMIVVFMIFAIVLPDLIDSLQSLLKINPADIQALIDDVQHNKWVAKGLKMFGSDVELGRLIADSSQQVLNQVLATLTGLLTSVSSIASTLMNLFLSLIFSIYVLGSKETLGRQFNLLLDTFMTRQAKVVHYVLNILHQRFHGFFVSQTLEAMILGSLTAIGMLLLGLPYVATIGVLISFTALIPVVGGMIGTAVGMILIMTQSFEQAMLFLIFTIILQQLEGNLIYPRVVGGSIGLPGMWVLLAITVGGAVGGILGMLISVPIFATLYQIIKDYTHKKHKQVQI